VSDTIAEAGRGGGRIALLVEDEPFRLDPLLPVLEELGFAVDLARTAREGLESIRARGYDLVVLDLYLATGDPRLDRKLGPDTFIHWGGVLILEEIARLDYRTLLVVTTASIGSAVEVRRITELEFHLLDKPVDPRRFRKILARLDEGVSP